MNLAPTTHCTPRPMFLTLGIAFSLLLPAHAEDLPTSTAPGSKAEATKTEEQASPEEHATQPFKVGVDLYYGLSNVRNYRKYNDHMWAGYGAFVPSTVYAAYENKRGYGAKLSIGTGGLFNTRGDEFYQPAEAWVKSPLGKSASVTLGKFWVPLALQEWEYESKPGVLFQWNRKAYDLSFAATHNRNTRTGNFYARLSRSWGEKATIGLSLAGGRGLSFDTDHDRGIGLDGQLKWRDWQFSTELLRFKAGSSGRFKFGWVKAAYNGWEKWTPFVARYGWDDELGQQGTFGSTVLGVVRQINDNFAVETSYARISDGDKYWVEVHYAWEK